MAANSSAAKSNSSRLSRVQHQAMRSTPISVVETVTGLQSIEGRQEIKVMTHAAKFNRLKDHRMHEPTDQSTKGRLKDPTSFSTAGSLKEKL